MQWVKFVRPNEVSRSVSQRSFTPTIKSVNERRCCYESFVNEFHFAVEDYVYHSAAQTSTSAPDALTSSSASSHISTFCLCSQKSAMKPNTCVIMTLERLGDESTSGMWNSARVCQGTSSVKGFATQVRFSLVLFLLGC